MAKKVSEKQQTNYTFHYSIKLQTLNTQEMSKHILFQRMVTIELKHGELKVVEIPSIPVVKVDIHQDIYF